MSHNIQTIPSFGAAIAYDPNGHTVVGRARLEPFAAGGVSIGPGISGKILTNFVSDDLPLLQYLRLVCTAAPAGAGNLTLKDRVTTPSGAAASIRQVVTISGLENITQGMVGSSITISGAASATNNGTFIVSRVFDDQSLEYVNTSAAPGAVAPDANNGAISWSIDSESGAAASIDSISSDRFGLTGVTGMTTDLVGRTVTISGATAPGNNGSFVILQVLSPTEIIYENFMGSAPDAANGAISWSVGALLTIPVVAAYAAGQVLEYQFPTPLKGFSGEPLAVDTGAATGTWLWFPNGFFMTEEVL